MEQTLFDTGPGAFSSPAFQTFLPPNNACFPPPEDAYALPFSNVDQSGLFLSGMESDAQTFQLRNGQLTPPSTDKTTPPNDTQPQAFYQFNAVPPQTITPRASWSGPSSSYQPEPPKQASSPPTENDEKRQKFLARNRVAASKCRHRKKEQVKQLQTLCEEVTAQKKKLEGQTDDLRNEVSSLKNELLKHAQCGDPAINMHLERMVTQTRNKDLGIPESPQLSMGQESSPRDKEEVMPMESDEVEDAIRRGSVLSMTTDTSGFSDEAFNDLVDIS